MRESARADAPSKLYLHTPVAGEKSRPRWRETPRALCPGPLPQEDQSDALRPGSPRNPDASVLEAHTRTASGTPTPTPPRMRTTAHMFLL